MEPTQQEPPKPLTPQEFQAALTEIESGVGVSVEMQRRLAATVHHAEVVEKMRYVVLERMLILLCARQGGTVQAREAELDRIPKDVRLQTAQEGGWLYLRAIQPKKPIVVTGAVPDRILKRFNGRG